MPETDLTKLGTHVYWLWAFTVLIAGLSIGAYVRLIEKDNTIVERMNNNDMTLRVQLAEIKTTLCSVSVTLAEVRTELRDDYKKSATDRNNNRNNSENNWGKQHE